VAAKEALQGPVRRVLQEPLKEPSQATAQRPCMWPRKRPCRGPSGGLFKGPLKNPRKRPRRGLAKVAAKEALQGPAWRVSWALKRGLSSDRAEAEQQRGLSGACQGRFSRTREEASKGTVERDRARTFSRGPVDGPVPGPPSTGPSQEMWRGNADGPVRKIRLGAVCLRTG